MDGATSRALLALGAVLLGGVALADVQAQLEQAGQAIEGRLADSPRPGVVIGITDRDRLRKVIVHGFADLKARTPLTPNSRFGIGSISKAFTAIALMQLSDEGRFDAHQPVTRYLPELKIKSPYAPVTGRDVLSHTAGLPYYLPDTASTRAVLLSLQEFTPSYAPGAHWLYSNTGFQLMGYVLENIEHGVYDAIIQRRVLVPLGMTATSAIIDDEQRDQMTVSYTRWPYDGQYVEAPWFEYLAGDGSIVSNVDDMAAYTRFYLNAGHAAGRRVLSERAFKALTTPVLDDYGYGVWNRQENGHTVISHSGGIAGFSSLIEAHTDEGFGLVFLSNGGMDASLTPWVAQLAAAAFADRPLPPAPPPDGDPLMAPLSDFVGHFESPAEGTSGMLDVRLVQGQLVVRGPEGERRLLRMGVNAFRAAPASGDSLGYFFARTDDKPEGAVGGLSHGAHWYVAASASPPAAAAPAAYATYVGHYVNGGPEGPEVWIFVRDAKLYAALFSKGYVKALQPVAEATFRVGEEYSPERMRFEGFLDGHAQRMSLSGVPLYRRETP